MVFLVFCQFWDFFVVKPPLKDWMLTFDLSAVLLLLLLFDWVSLWMLL